VHQAGGAYVSCGIQLSLAPDSDDPLVLWELEGTENVPKVVILRYARQVKIRNVQPSKTRLIWEAIA